MAAVSASTTTHQAPVTIEEAVRVVAAQGWVVRIQTETYAQLTHTAGKDGCLLALLFLLGIVPGFIYLLLPVSEQTFFISLDRDGNAIGRIDGGKSQRFERDEKGALWHMP